MSTNNDLFKKYLNPVFVETGSFTGTGIQEAINAGFEEIYSIELSEKYFNLCTERFKENKNVHIIKGDSSLVLFDLIKDIKTEITFWLDGHCSEGDTAKGQFYSPLLQELDQIKKHEIKSHTILIDDIRLWIPDENVNFGTKEIIAKVMEISDYQITYENGFVENDILVAKL